MANLTRDQRLIKENPNKTPYELLMLGLSEAKYQELLAHEDAVRAAPAQKVPQQTDTAPQTTGKAEPVIKAKTPLQRAIPMTNVAAPIITNSHDMAILRNKKTGKELRLTKGEALRQAKKYPQEYEVR